MVCIITSIDSVLCRAKPLNGLPFSIDMICLTAFYFLCGFTMRNKIAAIDYVKKDGGLLLFLTTAAFLSLHYFFNYKLYLAWGIYDNILVCTAEALCGIYITLAVSLIIARHELTGKVLAYIGSGSLFIFLFHFLIYNYVFSLLQGLDLGSFLSNIIAFPLAVCVPLLFWEIVKRNHYLSLLLLPLKSNKTLQTAGEGKGI